MQTVNGRVVDIQRDHGRTAPVNQRVVEIALEIEAGKPAAKPGNAKLMIAT